MGLICAYFIRFTAIIMDIGTILIKIHDEITNISAFLINSRAFSNNFFIIIINIFMNIYENDVNFINSRRIIVDFHAFFG